eukprot:6201712-Pleurochrysis_carterae.AAC.3
MGGGRVQLGSLHVQLLGGGVYGTPSSLMVTCERGESAVYLFNCGEGTQRFCTDHRLRIAGRLRRVLLTRLDWTAIGGLPGMLLTTASASTSRIGAMALHGPDGLAGSVQITKKHVFRSSELLL